MRCTRGHVLVATGVVLATLCGSHATIVTFQDMAHGGYVPTDHASRVVASDASLGLLQGDGWTPNISVETGSMDWGTNTLRPGTMLAWGAAYGDLWMVGTAGYHEGQAGWFSFTPDPGYAVRINRFELAGYPHLNYHNQPVLITDTDFNVLWSGGPYVKGEEDGFPSHSNYAPNLTSSETIYLLYGNNWNIGIDNIDFDQVAVPPCSSFVPADFNEDCAVDGLDVDLFKSCATGPATPVSAGCANRDLDGDGDLDQSDFGRLQRCYSRPPQVADPACAN